MEKIGYIIILLLLFTPLISAQTTDSASIENSNLQIRSKKKKALTVVYRETSWNGGVAFTHLPNDSISMKIKGMPFVTLSMNNYLSEQLLFSYFISPISIYQSNDEYMVFKQRCIQTELGIAGNYYLLRDLSLSLGIGGYLRFLNQHKTSGVWQKTDKDITAGVIGYAAISYWFGTNIALQCAGIITTDGYAIRTGIIINPKLIITALKKK